MDMGGAACTMNVPGLSTTGLLPFMQKMASGLRGRVGMPFQTAVENTTMTMHWDTPGSHMRKHTSFLTRTVSQGHKTTDAPPDTPKDT